MSRSLVLVAAGTVALSFGCSGGASEARAPATTESLPANTRAADRCDKPATSEKELAHCAVEAVRRGDADGFASLFPTREEVVAQCPAGLREFERVVEEDKRAIGPALALCAERIDWKTATVVETRGGGVRHQEKSCSGDLWEIEVVEVVVKQGEQERLVRLDDVLRIGGRYTVVSPPSCTATDTLVTEYEKMVNTICACPDMRCVEAAQKQMSIKSKELERQQPATEDEQALMARKLQPLMEKMMRCYAKVPNGTP